MNTHYNISNIDHIKPLKEYNEWVKSFLSDANCCIHMISEFVDAGISPSEARIPSMDHLLFSVNFFSGLLCMLSDITALAEKLTLDENKKNLSMWDTFISPSKELLNWGEQFPQHADSFCAALSDISSFADYWCAQKWLGGKSHVASLSCHLCDLCTRLYNEYQSVVKHIIFSMASIAEESVRMIKEVEALINELPDIKDPKFVTHSEKIPDNPKPSTVFTDCPISEEVEIKCTQVPVNPGTPEYIHVNGITYQNGTIQYRKLIDPKDAPLYANMPRSYWKTHTRNLSTAESQKLLADISAIPLEPLYDAMISDPYGATPGFCGASYSILEIHYSDGQMFRFEMHRSIPNEYFKIHKRLSALCTQPQIQEKT